VSLVCHSTCIRRRPSRTAPDSKKAKWKPAERSDEGQGQGIGLRSARSKVEGLCYEVYGVKEGKLYELFYSPEDLSLKKTIAKN
jgi:hypothetical protein